MKDYLNYMINCIFKILPLKEEDNKGLKEYLDSVLIQVLGSIETYPELSDNQKYVSIINTLYYLKNNDFTTKQCKRETFKCINILQEMIDR